MGFGQPHEGGPYGQAVDHRILNIRPECRRQRVYVIDILMLVRMSTVTAQMINMRIAQDCEQPGAKSLGIVRPTIGTQRLHYRILHQFTGKIAIAT